MNAAAGDLQHRPTREGLELLLGEVNTLAIRLRHLEPGVGAEDLPSAARAVLQTLHREGALAVPHIARLKSTSRQNIQTIVNRLKADGHIRLSPNPAHKRSELVSITEQGELMLARAEGLCAPSLERIAAQVSEAELLSGVDLIRKLRQALTGAHPVQRKTPGVQPKETLSEAAVPESEPQEEDNELPVNLL